MTTINELFCTPDQGRRLAELVPTLMYHFAWVEAKYMTPTLVHRTVFTDSADYAPALTLQELRDIAKGKKIINGNHGSYRRCNSTAPELAQWVIDRLTEVDNA